jgi:two-component system phosphate regulon sensor histidine kinase PhoR
LPRRISIAAKFFLTYFVITGAALAFAGMAGYLQFKRYVIEEADASLKAQALLAAESFRPLLAATEPDRGTIAREGDRLGRDLDTRLTVILPGGEVAADSQIGSAHLGELENHADRPEVKEALSGRTGFSHRRAISVKEEHRYCAVPILSGGEIVGVARTSISGGILNRQLHRVRVIT